MYRPAFNKVLVEIDDADAQWGGGNDESMLGKSFSKGKVIEFGHMIAVADYPVTDEGIAVIAKELVTSVKGKNIMWHEGAEAGTVHEVDGKQYGLIYWWDIVGVQE